MDEPDEHPLRHQLCLRGDDGLEQGEVRALGVARAGMVAVDRVIGQAPQQLPVAAGRRVLEAADPQVTFGDPGQHGPGQHGVALHRPAGGHHGQRAGGQDAQRVHGLADHVLAQHRSDRGQIVAAAGEQVRPEPEVDVAQPPGGVGDLAEQQCAAVAEARDVAAELVARVGLRDRDRAGRHVVADQEAQPVRAAQPGRVQAEVGGERLVEQQQFRFGGYLGLPRDGQFRQRAAEAVLQDHGRVGCDAHLIQTTEVECDTTLVSSPRGHDPAAVR